MITSGKILGVLLALSCISSIAYTAIILINLPSNTHSAIKIVIHYILGLVLYSTGVSLRRKSYNESGLCLR